MKGGDFTKFHLTQYHFQEKEPEQDIHQNPPFSHYGTFEAVKPKGNERIEDHISHGIQFGAE